MVQAIAGQDAPAILPEKSWLAEALFFASTILPQGVGTPFSPNLESSYPFMGMGSDFMHHYGLDAARVEALLVSTSEEFDRIRESFGG
jgi:hypothetical protein